MNHTVECNTIAEKVVSESDSTKEIRYFREHLKNYQSHGGWKVDLYREVRERVRKWEEKKAELTNLKKTLLETGEVPPEYRSKGKLKSIPEGGPQRIDDLILVASDMTDKERKKMKELKDSSEVMLYEFLEKETPSPELEKDTKKGRMLRKKREEFLNYIDSLVVKLSEKRFL
ncbi:MAG: hypothetical protein DRP11_04575 [Candidatus Aenigmatarchaeota archaeon]|nr:MAG: hypothetical protein DRP11_04575 [Candidatus Aenigmarchaeota archaeon]